MEGTTYRAHSAQIPLVFWRGVLGKDRCNLFRNWRNCYICIKPFFRAHGGHQRHLDILQFFRCFFNIVIFRPFRDRSFSRDTHIHSGCVAQGKYNCECRYTAEQCDYGSDQQTAGKKLADAALASLFQHCCRVFLIDPAQGQLLDPRRGEQGGAI